MGQCLSTAMPGLVPGNHVFGFVKQDVDGRDKPGHDGENLALELGILRANIEGRSVHGK
jgi:hypothetical protein